MKRQLFIGARISPVLGKKFSRLISQWKDMPVRWIRREDWVIPLFPLGIVEDENLSDISNSITEALLGQGAFDASFHSITLFPDGESPKAVRLNGADCEELREIYTQLGHALGQFSSEKKSFRPHIILGSIRKQEWRDLLEKPELYAEVKIDMPVEDIIIGEYVTERKDRVLIPVDVFLLGE